MKKNVECYTCVYCQTCNEEQEKKCAEINYALLTTKEAQELCDLMCGTGEEADLLEES